MSRLRAIMFSLGFPVKKVAQVRRRQPNGADCTRSRCRIVSKPPARGGCIVSDDVVFTVHSQNAGQPFAHPSLMEDSAMAQRRHRCTDPAGRLEPRHDSLPPATRCLDGQRHPGEELVQKGSRDHRQGRRSDPGHRAAADNGDRGELAVFDAWQRTQSSFS